MLGKKRIVARIQCIVCLVMYENDRHLDSNAGWVQIETEAPDGLMNTVVHAVTALQHEWPG